GPSQFLAGVLVEASRGSDPEISVTVFKQGRDGGAFTRKASKGLESVALHSEQSTTPGAHEQVTALSGEHGPDEQIHYASRFIKSGPLPALVSIQPAALGADPRRTVR